MEPGGGWSPLRRRSKDRKAKEKERDLVVTATANVVGSSSSPPPVEEAQQQQQDLEAGQQEKGSSSPPRSDPSSSPSLSLSWSEAKERRRSQRADAHADIIGGPHAGPAATLEVNAIAIGLERLRLNHNSSSSSSLSDDALGGSAGDGHSSGSPETTKHGAPRARGKERDKGKEKAEAGAVSGSSSGHARVPAISMAFLRGGGRDHNEGGGGSSTRAAASEVVSLGSSRSAGASSSSSSSMISASPSQKMMRRSVGQRGLTAPAAVEPRLIHHKLQRDRTKPKGSPPSSSSSSSSSAPSLVTSNRVPLTDDQVQAQRQREEKEEIYAVIRPASLQKAVWSFLYTAAAGMFSEEQLPHFVHLVKHTAFLLPDPTARIHLLEALDSGGDEQIKSKEEGLVWLWELHQQVNRNIPDPFVFVEPGLSSGLSAGELAQLLKDIWAQPEFKLGTSQIVRTPPRGREELSSLLAQKIPDEVLLGVFQMLPTDMLRRQVAVCRRWRRLASDPSLWRPRFHARWTVIRPLQLEIALMAETWRSLFLQFRGWDRLKKRFDARETPDNLFFEAGEEEWVEEEKEVAVLSEEEVLDDDDAAANADSSTSVRRHSLRLTSITMARQTSFRERTMRTTRRRRRLSLELAGMIEREVSSELRKYSFSESLTESGERRRRASSAARERLGPLPDLKYLLPPPVQQRLDLDGTSRGPYKRDDPEENGAKKKASDIKFATLPKLVVYLTHPAEHDLEFVKTFMLTYENFTSPRNLFKLLIRRYFMEPPAGCEGADREEWTKSVQSPIRLRVCNVIKMWVEKCSSQLQSDRHLIDHIHKFASKVVTGSMSLQLVRLLQQIKRQGGAREPTSYQFSRQPPYPEVPKNLFSPSLKVWDISELELARQLTIMEFHCFTKIQAVEFISYCWCSDEAEEQKRAPNLLHTICRFRQLARWVRQHIASIGPKSKPLTRIVKRFIQLANRLLQLNNFNTAMAILHGINQWAVSASSIYQVYSVQSLKLTTVWPELSKRDKKDFECIEKLMVNEELYRETLLHIPGSPHIPYLDFHLCKILSAEEHIPSTVRGMVNFEKSKYLYNLVSQLMQHQEHPYNLQPVSKIIDLLSATVYQLNDS